MGEIATLFARIGADTSGLDRGLRKTRSGLQSMSNAVTRVGKIAAAGLAVGSVALGKLGADSLSMAADFESALAILSTAIDPLEADMATLSEAALKMGADTELVGISASDAVDAMTILAKAGLSTAEIFGGENGLNDFLADNAKLAGAARAAADLQAASELGLAEAAELVAVAMKTFNLSSEEAVNIGDSFVKAADASVASVSDLAQAMENVGPTAASFGFSLNDTNTALAILSTRGIRGAEAGTALKSMFTNLMRPTAAVKGTLADLGVTLFDVQGNMKSLPDIIGSLESSMAGLTQEQRLSAIQTLAGTFGMKAMTTLLGEGATGWDNMTQAMKDAASAQEIARVRTETYQGKLEAFEGVVESLKIRIGNVLLPAMTALAIKFTEFTEKHGDKLIEVFKGIVSTVRRLPETLRPVISLISKFVELIKDNKDRVIGAIKGIGAAFAGAAIANKIGGIVKALGMLTNPIGLIIGAAALLGIAWEENWGGIRETVAAVWETLGPIFESIVAWLEVNIPKAIEFLVGVWEAMRPGVEAVWNGIVLVIESAIGLIQTIWETILKPIIDGIKIDWDAVRVAVEIVWNTITTVIETALGVISAIFDTVSALFRGDWETFWNGIKDIVEGIWKIITDLWNGFWSLIQLIFGGVIGTITEAWDNFWGGLSRVAKGIIDGIVGFVNGLIGAVQDAIAWLERLITGASAADVALREAKGSFPGGDGTGGGKGKGGQSGLRNFVVPATPGRSGDAFPMRFRAGERVTVDTPGNAGRGGNMETNLLLMQLLQSINQLPRQIRDGIKLGMA